MEHDASSSNGNKQKRLAEDGSEVKHDDDFKRVKLEEADSDPLSDFDAATATKSGEFPNQY